MCVDLKNVKKYQSSGRLGVLPPIAGTALVIVLFGWILRELPTAIDPELGIVPTTEISPVQVYHPSTHALILSAKWRAALPPYPLGSAPVLQKDHNKTSSVIAQTKMFTGPSWH